MTRTTFLIGSLAVMLVAGVVGGVLLPMAGLENAVWRYVCFGIGGGIVGWLYTRMKGATRA